MNRIQSTFYGTPRISANRYEMKICTIISNPWDYKAIFSEH